MTDVIGFLPTTVTHGSAVVRGLQRRFHLEARAGLPPCGPVHVHGFDELPDLSFGPGRGHGPAGGSPPSPTRSRSIPLPTDRAGLRRRPLTGPSTTLLFAAVGGTAVGLGLLELTRGRLPVRCRRKQVPDARMLLVTGPRIDPRLLPDIEGMDKRGYVPDLFEHLACADAAIVQGGLSTTMELVGAGRPFMMSLCRHWKTAALRHPPAQPLPGWRWCGWTTRRPQQTTWPPRWRPHRRKLALDLATGRSRPAALLFRHTFGWPVTGATTEELGPT